MRKKKLASLIVLVFVLLCNCDYFKSLCEPENAPKKQPTTLQNIVNKATDGEIINLEEWENVTDYTATIDKKLTIKSGNLNGASLTVKAENVKLEKMQNLSVETSSRLTIKDSKLNNLLLDGNAQSRSNTTAEINVILENCEIAEKIKINSQAKLNITGKKTKIAKIVVAVVETLCKIFCAEELDTTEIKDIIVDEDNKKLEDVKVSKAYKIVYHSNCDELEDIEDFFSPDDGTISLPTDIFNRDGYIFTGWYKDEACKQIFDNFDVSNATADINVYAGWTKYIPGSGVYKYSINIEDIPESGPWNGSRTSPAFSILLLTEKLIDASIKHGDFYFSNDAYQIQTRASENLRITDTSKTGNYAVYGEVPTNIDSIPENDKYKYYSGVAATVTDTTLEIFVDMSKIVKTELKVFRKSESSTAQEEFVTENTLIDLTDYKPYIIALGTKGSLFTSLTWDADLMAMTGNATFPTNLQQSAPTTGNTNEVKELTATADTVADTIRNLSAGTYMLKVSGVTNTTITEIATAMNSNTEAKINLDLSETDGLTEIADSAFSNCFGLTSITIPNNVISIGVQAFFSCSSLTEITIPDSVTTIGTYAFSNCSSLTSIEIPNSVTTIGTYAFCDCSSLTRITIPNSVTFIGDSAFSWCTNLTSVTINNGVTTIGSNAFYYCENLTSVTIPNSVTTIGDQAFHSCSSLKSITIPDSVESIGSFSFVGCNNLTTFEVGTNNSNFSSSNDKHILFNKDKTELIAYPSAKDDVTTILDSDSVTTIKSGAFEACSGLTSLTIPDSVITIEFRAIPDCINLKTVIIGSGVETIGAEAFSGCSGLTSVTFKDPNGWYYNHDSGNKITIDVTTDPAQNAENLKDTYSRYYWYRPTELTATADTVTVTDNNNNTETINFSELSTKLSTLSAGTYTLKVTGEITSTTITTIATAMNSNTEAKINLDLSGANGVTTIGSNAFRDCSSLTSVTIGNGVTSIGDYAFYECSSLTSIEIPNSVTTIGEGAFFGCLSLTSVTIPNSVTTIGDYAFTYCSNLKNVTIGSSVNSIGASAFSGCSRLTTFEVATNNQYYSSLENEKILYSKDQKTLIAYPSAEGDFTIPNSVTSIADGAFHCSNLTNVTIPDSVTTIKSGAFHSCLSLTSVTIPNSVTTLGDYAFYYCENLTSVTFADTAGWYYNDDSGEQKTINVTDNTEGNATYLKETYSGYSWYKESSTGGTTE